jgi:hypothetical protein
VLIDLLDNRLWVTKCLDIALEDGKVQMVIPHHILSLFGLWHGDSDMEKVNEGGMLDKIWAGEKIGKAWRNLKSIWKEKGSLVSEKLNGTMTMVGPVMEGAGMVQDISVRAQKGAGIDAETYADERYADKRYAESTRKNPKRVWGTHAKKT